MNSVYSIEQKYDFFKGFTKESLQTASLFELGVERTKMLTQLVLVDDSDIVALFGGEGKGYERILEQCKALHEKAGNNKRDIMYTSDFNTLKTKYEQMFYFLLKKVKNDAIQTTKLLQLFDALGTLDKPLSIEEKNIDQIIEEIGSIVKYASFNRKAKGNGNRVKVGN